MRVEKDFVYRERYKLELIAQAFNIANHQNETEIFGTAYNIGGTVAAPTLTYQSTWGTEEQTNNSGFSFTPREIELTARISF
jgi:hypothetical protein